MMRWDCANVLGELSVVELLRDKFFFSNGRRKPSPLIVLGGMLRDRKAKTYPLAEDLAHVRQHPGAGNVWQHLRAFDKRLFDRIPEHGFRLDDSADAPWITRGTDWAYMIPMVEMAGPDRVEHLDSTNHKLYLWEECQLHTVTQKHLELAQTRRRLMNLPSVDRFVCVDELEGAAAASESTTAAEAMTECRLPTSMVQVADGVDMAPPMLRTLGMGSVRVLYFGDITRTDLHVPVRLHSACFSGDVLGSKRCDCREQLHSFLRAASAKSQPAGVLVYMHDHEGRGNGWLPKAREYAILDKHPQADHCQVLASLPGCEQDKRDYTAGVAALRELGVNRVVLFTNNPHKEEAMRRWYSQADGSLAIQRMPAAVTQHNRQYLQEKVRYLGHDVNLLALDLEQQLVCDVQGHLGAECIDGSSKWDVLCAAVAFFSRAGALPESQRAGSQWW